MFSVAPKHLRPPEDIGARQETLAVRGEPIMLQLCVVPAYALTTGDGYDFTNARWVHGTLPSEGWGA